MTVRKEAQMAELEAYWAALGHDTSAVPPAALDAGLARTVQRLRAGLAAAEPSETFVGQLGRRLQSQAAEMAGADGRSPARTGGWWQRLRGRALAARPLQLSGAILAVAGLVALVVIATRPQAVSAQAIMEQAQAVASSPSVGGVHSFVLTTVWHAWQTAGSPDTQPGGADAREIVSETRHWYGQAGRWRSESQQRVLRSDGTEISRAGVLQVSDGRDLWHYDVERNLVTVNHLSGQDFGGTALPFRQGVSDLATLFEQASTCYEARITGSATVAGRPTHVIDLGPNRCPSTSAPEMNGRRVIWVDKETFFVLRQEQYSVEGDQLIQRGEVTEVEYNAPIDESIFTFVPPEGSRVFDGRPQAVPTLRPSSPALYATPAPVVGLDSQQAALLGALEPLARTADYPLFVPAGIPAGLAPRLPRMQPKGDEFDRQLWLEYAPIGEVELDTAPALRIVEQRATYEDVQSWTVGAIPMRVLDGQAWVRLAVQDIAKSGRDSEVIILRDGTLLSLSSSTLAPEDLLAIAASLLPVPGGHAPLSAPQPPAGTEAQVQPTPADLIPTLTPMPTPAFEVLRPTWLPEPVTVREQVEGDIVLLGFVPEGHDGTSPVLTLREMPLSIAGQGGSPDPQASQETIGGHAVTVIRRGQGCVSYTWDVGELRLTLSNVYVTSGELMYTCEQMSRIVASVR